MANKNVIMFCTKCGEQLEVDPDIEFSFCPYCGTKNKTIKRRNDTNSIDKDPQNEMKEESNQSQSSETGFHPKKAKEDSLYLERIVGMEGLVTVEIKKDKIGEVKVDGKLWSATSDTNIPVENMI